MTKIDEVAKQTVVNECLEACYRSRSPLNELAARVAALRARDWEEADIRQVELAVLRLLVGMMSDDKNSPDDTIVE